MPEDEGTVLEGLTSEAGPARSNNLEGTARRTAAGDGALGYEGIGVRRKGPIRGAVHEEPGAAVRGVCGARTKEFARCAVGDVAGLAVQSIGDEDVRQRA